MVSSKCFQVESPSPFRFLAALMPPCAHTECERLTGTMENRSTCPPASATLMAAESPANPPPTTMMRGFAVISILCLAYVTRFDHLRAGFRYGLSRMCSERPQTEESDN